MRLDPRRLLTFREVARRRSFSQAALELSLTQSAVSQQIAALERQLGLRLLHRGRGGVQPTPAGEWLLGHATALAERLDLAASQLDELAHAHGRRLRIGAFPSALATVVPTAAARVAKRMPELELHLREGTTGQLAAGVRSGDLHLAICFQDASHPKREHDATRRRELFTEPMLLVLPPDHPHARRRAVRLADLAHDSWTAPSRDGLIARACHAAGFQPRITVLTSDPLAIGAVVRAGLAVTMTARLLTAHLPGVRIAAVAGEPPRRAVYALLPDSGARALDLQLLDELAQLASG